MVVLVHRTDVNTAYIILGGFAVIFTTVSLLVREKLYLGEVVIATAFGVICGPYAANIFDPRSWNHYNDVTLEVMRIVLAVGLFAIGVELPKSYLWKQRRSLLVMVVPTMAIGWVISAGLIYALFPRLNFVSALAISATLTPTDPILANAIINGRFAVKHVPKHLRKLLSAESAANDGLAYPFLTISLYLTLDASSKVAVKHWFLIGWLYEVFLGIVLGAVIGKLFGMVMRFSRQRGFIDRESYVAQYLALALATTGLANLLGSDDLLAAFAAGSAVSWDGDFNDQTEDEVFSAVIDLLLNIACFIYIGAWLPFSQWYQPELGIVPWKLIVLFIGILLLRRIPAIIAIHKFVPDIRGWREALFCGHFGPMGVGAVFISTLALSELPEPDNPPRDQADILALSIHPIVSFVVLGSIMIHGLSIPFFNIGRQMHTYTYTWSRSRPASISEPPDWLTSVRRYRGGDVLPKERPPMTPGGGENGTAAQAVDGMAGHIELSMTSPSGTRTTETGQGTPGHHPYTIRMSEGESQVRVEVSKESLAASSRGGSSAPTPTVRFEEDRTLSTPELEVHEDVARNSSEVIVHVPPGGRVTSSEQVTDMPKPEKRPEHHHSAEKRVVENDTVSGEGEPAPAEKQPIPASSS